VVEDHPAVRYGIRRLIAEQPDLVTIAEAGSASEATSALGRWVDVAVIDYHLGDGDGLSLAQQIKQRQWPPAVLIYSAFADLVLAVAAIVAGADGLLSKAALTEELPIAIRRLSGGREHFPAVPQSVAVALSSRLDPRDQAIFSMLLHGVAPMNISSQLGLAPRELEARRRQIVRAIAPGAAHFSSLSGAERKPLDYERARRRPRYPAAG
jgi:DNA-binding NarL/FixJ family response regulator